MEFQDKEAGKDIYEIYILGNNNLLPFSSSCISEAGSIYVGYDFQPYEFKPEKKKKIKLSVCNLTTLLLMLKKKAKIVLEAKDDISTKYFMQNFEKLH